MRKFFLLALLTSLILSGCKRELRKEQTDFGTRPLTYDTMKIAILPWNRISPYPFDSLHYKEARLTQDDLNQLDSLIVFCVTTYNNCLTPGHDEYKIDLKSNEYKIQLIAVTDSRDEKQLWVNCFCNESGAKWRTKILSVDDGGPCYFNFKIDLSTKRVYDLSVNGFA